MTWADRVDGIGSVPKYVAPDWRIVKCRCLKPFNFRAERHLRNGMIIPLEMAHVLEVGEVFECIEPYALDWIAQGKAELV